MKKVIPFLLAVLILCSACSSGTPASTSAPATQAPAREKAYVYPGEERQMAYQNPVFEKEAFAEGASYTPKFTDEALRDQFSYTGTIHWIESHNNHVFSVLVLPDDYDAATSCPLVLMLHGFNSTLDEWNYYVKPLNDAGYACLLFDFRGGHSGNASRSDGKMTQMSFDTKLADVRSAVEYAASLDCVDASRMILAGHSQGGMMALITMCDNELSNLFKGVLLLAPYTDAAIVAHYEKPEDVPDTASLLLCTVGKDYLYSAWKYEHSIWSKLPDYSLPVLILTGGADEIVSVSSVQKVAETVGTNAEFSVVENAFHDFQPEIVTEVVSARILPFFSALVK